MKPPVSIGQGSSRRDWPAQQDREERMRACDWLAVGFCVALVLVYLVIR
jgi:hypothetical protein